MEGIENGKEDIELSLFADGLIFYIKTSQTNLWNKPLAVISEFCKVPGHMVNKPEMVGK